MGKKYTGYNYLSAHGEKFVDLSNEKLVSRLTAKQRYYLEQYERMHRADLSKENADYYLGLPDDVRAEVRYRQKRILTGQAYRDSQRTYFDNYVTGLRNNGANSVADLLEQVYKSKRGALQRQSLIDNMPSLDLHYGRSAEAKAQLSEITINDTIGQAASDIINYALEKNINVIGDKFTMKDLSGFMEMGFVDDEALMGIREQMLRTKGTNRQDLAAINDMLGLKSDDKESYE